MSVFIDVKSIDSIIIPKIKKTNVFLQDARDISTSLKRSVPSSFSYKGMVNDIANQLYTIEKEINDANALIIKKVDKARAIESKSESRVSGIAAAASKIGAITGGIVGAAVGVTSGGIVGAAVGATVGVAAGETIGESIIKTGAKIVGEFVSGVGKVILGIFNFAKDTASKIANGIKSIWQKFSGTIKSLASSVSSAVTKIGKALYNTGAKVVEGFTSFCKNIWQGAKNLGKKIYEGCQKIAKSVKSFIQDKMLPVISDILEGIKNVGVAIVRTAASIFNSIVSVVEGIVSFVEAIGDTCLIIIGAAFSTITFISDLVYGIITGNWEWPATSAVWKKWIMPWIGYDWTSKVFDGVYSTWPMKAIDDLSFDAFKRGGVVYSIGKSVGYYTGMIIATTLTAGAATAAGATGIGSLSVNTITQASLAATASLGKNTQKNYNSAISSNINEYYIEQLMKENPNLTRKQAESIVSENIKNNVYTDYEAVRQYAMDNISGLEIAGSIGKAAGTAAIDGGIYFAAGAMGDYAKSLGDTVSFVTKHSKGLQIGIKATKAYISEGYNSIVNGDKYDFLGATIDAAGIIIAENVSNAFGNLSKYLGQKGGFLGSLSKIKYKTTASSNVVVNNSSEAVDALNEASGTASKRVIKLFVSNIFTDSTLAFQKGAEKGEEKLIKEIVSEIYEGFFTQET